MSFAKNLIDELVSKRLWPIALLLLAAIVAIPVLLGGTGTGAGAGTGVAQVPVPAAAAERSAANAVELVGPPSVRSRPGADRDPFRRPAPKSPKSPAGAGAGAGAKQAPPASAPDSPTHGSPLKIPVPPVVQHTTPVRALYAHRTAIRWAADGDTRTRTRGISRLTPLGLLADPGLLYLGVSTDGKWAMFLLGPNATSTGDARCSDEQCRIIGLKRGMSQVVDVTPATGEAYQRRLDVKTVERVEIASRVIARRTREYEHPDGRDAVREMLKDAPTAKALGSLSYEPDRGVLVPASAAS